MNLRYRLGQIKNSIIRPSKQTANWVFVYGVPRSGTTYFYHALLQHAKVGISDFDLGEFLTPIQHIESSGYIPIDTDALKQFLRGQLRDHGAPGGGSRWDYVVKQVNTSKAEFELIQELMGCPPSSIQFLFREPTGWLQSAMKKYKIGEKEAEEMYRSSLGSYNEIGGTVIEYGSELERHLNLIGLNSHVPFELSRNERGKQIEDLDALQGIYNQFKENLVT